MKEGRHELQRSLVALNCSIKRWSTGVRGKSERRDVRLATMNWNRKTASDSEPRGLFEEFRLVFCDGRKFGASTPTEAAYRRPSGQNDRINCLVPVF
jgi:hypothetical protein